MAAFKILNCVCEALLDCPIQADHIIIDPPY